MRNGIARFRACSCRVPTPFDKTRTSNLSVFSPTTGGWYPPGLKKNLKRSSDAIIAMRKLTGCLKVGKVAQMLAASYAVS